MTVEELISCLQIMPQDAVVLVSAYEFDLTEAQAPALIDAAKLEGDDLPEGTWGGDWREVRSEQYSIPAVYIAGERHDQR